MSYSIGLSLSDLPHLSNCVQDPCMLSKMSGYPSFLLLNNNSYIWYINHIIFLHSSVDGHLGCFCILNIVNKAAISVGVYIFLKNTVFISFGYVLSSGVTGLYGRPTFNFLRNRHIVFHTIEPICIPISSV